MKMERNSTNRLHSLLSKIVQTSKVRAPANHIATGSKSELNTVKHHIFIESDLIVIA